MKTISLLHLCSIYILHVFCDTGSDNYSPAPKFDIQKELQDIRNQLYHETTIRLQFDKELSAMARRYRTLSFEQTNAKMENMELKKQISAMSQSLTETVNMDEWAKLNDTVASLRSIVREQNDTIMFLKGCNSSVVAFTAILSHDVKLGQKSTVIYDRILTNIGKGYNNLTGIFTAPASGLYSVSVSMMARPSDGIHLNLVKDGIELVRLWTQSGRYELSSHTINIPLKRDDQLWVRQYSGINLYGGENYNVFTAILLREGDFTQQ